MRTAAARVSKEAFWWLHVAWRMTCRFPGPVLVLLAVGWLVGPALPLSLVVVLLLLVLALRIAALLWPAGFHRRLVAPTVGQVHRRRMRRHWPSAAAACGLGVPTHLGRTGQPDMDQVAVPRLLRSRVDGMRVQLRVRLLMGQTVEHVEKAADALRSALAASHVRVDRHLANEVLLTFTVGDVLTAPFTARPPQPGGDRGPSPRRHGSPRGRHDVAPAGRPTHARCRLLGGRQGVGVLVLRVRAGTRRPCRAACSCTASTSRAAWRS